MWLRLSKCLFTPTNKSSLTNNLQLIRQFRTKLSGGSRRSIKNFDESNVLRVEPKTEPHPSRLLIRPTVFTLGVGRSFR